MLTSQSALQGEVFAAEGYAKVTGEVGVCIATSGPGATNLVTGLADALLDSVPMVAITGQVTLFQACRVCARCSCPLCFAAFLHTAQESAPWRLSLELYAAF